MLGVSHTTVYLALRNDPRLPPATRDKVLRAAAKAGYWRDPVISELMARLRASRKRSGRLPLGFVTAWPSRNGWREAVNHVRFFSGASARASEIGYYLEEFWLAEEGMSSQRLSAILRTRGIRGLILFSIPEPQGSVALDWRHFAAVTKGLTIVHPVMHRVISSHYDDMLLALSRIAECRCSRVGLALSKAISDRVGGAWLAAYYLRQHDLPTENRLPVFFVPDSNADSAFGRWMADNRPDVVVFAESIVVDCVTRLGIKVPRDLGLVHLNWSPDIARFAGIDSAPDTLGAAAVDLLAGQLIANEFGVPLREKVVEVRGRWVNGRTLPRRSV